MSEIKTTEIDLRKISVVERHPRIFEAWEEIPAGDTLRITNDHDPKPLRYQFESEYPDTHKWNYVKSGPEEWVVDILKLELDIPTGEELRAKIEEALNEVRPYLEADGGGVELIDVDEQTRTVRVQLQGACGGCPSAGMTLKAGVEKSIKKHIPGIRYVEPI